MNITYSSRNEVVLFICQSEEDFDSILNIIWQVSCRQARLGNIVFDVSDVFKELEKNINTPILIPTEPLAFIIDIMETTITFCKDQNMASNNFEFLLDVLKSPKTTTNTKH